MLDSTVADNGKYPILEECAEGQLQFSKSACPIDLPLEQRWLSSRLAEDNLNNRLDRQRRIDETQAKLHRAVRK